MPLKTRAAFCKKSKKEGRKNFKNKRMECFLSKNLPRPPFFIRNQGELYKTSLFKEVVRKQVFGSEKTTFGREF